MVIFGISVITSIATVAAAAIAIGIVATSIDTATASTVAVAPATLSPLNITFNDDPPPPASKTSQPMPPPQITMDETRGKPTFLNWIKLKKCKELVYGNHTF
jgi:hypothetical protein